MTSLSSINGCARRSPCQRRGEDRVRSLLAAAVAEFAAVGYEAATMSSIAARADASIGSLYQFFPDKPSVARAVRARQIEDVEASLSALRTPAGVGDVDGFVNGFVDIMARFVDEHPAFLPLLDAPSSTTPAGARNRVRQRLMELIQLLRPRVSEATATRTAEVALRINKAMLGLLAGSKGQERGWVFEEYRGIMRDYFGRHAASKRGGRVVEGPNRVRRGHRAGEKG